MKILAIDPGPEKSGWVYAQPADKVKPVIAHGHDHNLQVRAMIRTPPRNHVDAIVIEDLEPRRQPLGSEVAITLKWIGRFYEVAFEWYDTVPMVLRRREVCRWLTGDPWCGDKGIATFLYDRYGPGRQKAMGTVGQPGPLHGMKVHEFAALALAIAYAEKHEKFDKLAHSG